MLNNFKPILTYPLAFLVAVFSGACTENTSTRTEEIRGDIPESVMESDEQAFPPYPAIDSVSVLTEIDREALPFNGRFITGASWNDGLGNNVLILSERGAYEAGNGRKEIFAYHYVRGDTSYNALWRMNDFVDGWGCDLNVQMINYFPLVSDVDANGVAETAIFYALNNRCDAVPFPAKLIVHEGGQKLVIRGIIGQFLGPPEAVNNEYRANEGLPPLKYKNMETDEATMDKSIIDFYARQWDEFIALENKLNGSLPDSLITIID